MVPDPQPANIIAGLMRRIESLERQLREYASTFRALESSTIGAGGLTVKDGGNVIVEGGGGVDLRNSGRVRMYTDDGTQVGSMYVAGLDLIDPVTGGAMSMTRGLIRLWDDYDGNTNRPGRILVDQGRGLNMLRLFPPYESGSGIENSISIRGERPGQTGYIWLYSSGSLLQDVDGSIFEAAAQIDSSAVGSNTVRGQSVVLSTTGEEMPIYGLPTTSAGANLHLGTVGGKWTMAYITSSRRYKQDIKDAPIKADAALSWKPKVWRDISEVKAVGEKAMTHIGFIAEEVAEVSPEFVVHDAQGRPDSLNYDRMVAGVVVAIQAQEKRAADDRARTVALEAKVEAQAQQIAALKDANTALGLRLDKITAALKKAGISL